MILLQKFYQIDLDILKKLTQSCDKLSLKVRKNNTNIKEKGGYFIMLDKIIKN